ncbi:MAG: tetratricopeptide repeat protein, partial [Planctomycetota bacterium]
MALLLSPYVPAQDFPPSAKDALKLVYEGRYGDALPLVEAELAKLPKNVALLHLRAVCKGKLGRHEEAIADASAAIELDPRHAGSYGERAYNLFQSGKVDQALADYDKSVELDPKNPMVHGERGDALLELGRYRDAMSAYDEASRLVPKWPNPHSQRGRAATSLADFEAAHVSFARAVELAPDDLFSRFCLAGAQFDCRLDDEALDTARRLSRRSPDSYSIALRGRLAWQLDRYELAREELAKAAGRGKPGERLDAQLSLGILLLAQGESQAALDGMPYDEDLQKTETLAPWLSLTRWCARYALGLRDEAHASLTAELAACSEVDDEVRELADLLTGEAPVTSFETPDGEHAAESCPALFFAGWRALIDGKEARADELLLQCVETGAKQYMQWQAARTVLLR